MSNIININVNKTDLGLNNVDNTSDLNKPISTATQTALNGKEDVSNKSTNTSLGTSDTLYPTQKAVKTYVDNHAVSVPDATASVKGVIKLTGDLGGTADSPTVPALSNYLLSSLKGANNGLAELDGAGKVPSSQLPSYVDDVVEVANFAALPVTGESGKIYITLDNNLTFRWSGSAYVEISASLALGELSTTAYRGDRGKTAYDHSQLTSGNPHNVTKMDVGLSNVPNTDATNPANIVQTSTYRFVSDTEKSSWNAKIDGNGSVNYIAKFTDADTIDESQIFDNGTSVGIGTNTPSSAVSVDAKVLAIADPATTNVGSFRAYGGSISGGTATSIELFGAAAYVGLYGSTDTPMTFSTNGSEKMRISSAGSVGIGTSSPDAKLHITNELNIDSFKVFDEATDSTMFVIDDSGNVGVGLPFPTTKLDVSGNIKISTIDNATTDTDKFLVSDSGVIKYRTGAELLSDINGASKDLTLDRKTASYTLVSSDNNKLIEMNVGSANNVTINNSVFTAGNQILVSQYGAGQVTFVAGSGVTLRSPSGKLKLTGQYSLATIICISATEFYISGDLTA